jgi:hypothetical protein
MTTALPAQPLGCRVRRGGAAAWKGLYGADERATEAEWREHHLFR